MKSATATLEELEARCDVLSRRVGERGGALRSPPRSDRGQPQTSYSTNAQEEIRRDDRPVSAMQQQQNPLSQIDISNAVVALEREKVRLEDQLRLVNTHLNAYKWIQQQHQESIFRNGTSINESVVEPIAAQYATPSPILQQPQAVPSRRGGSPVNASLAANSQVAFHDRKSVQLPSPLPAASQTEEIYAELKAIRKMREEREAQRHQQLQSQVSAPPSYTSSGLRY